MGSAPSPQASGVFSLLCGLMVCSTTLGPRVTTPRSIFYPYQAGSYGDSNAEKRVVFRYQHGKGLDRSADDQGGC
jgi:hypothetical protein